MPHSLSSQTTAAPTALVAVTVVATIAAATVIATIATATVIANGSLPLIPYLSSGSPILQAAVVIDSQLVAI